MTASMDTCEGCAEMGAVPPCERSHWGPRWSSLWGHETCEGCAEMGAVPPCERSHWGPRWSSLRGHEACEGHGRGAVMRTLVTGGLRRSSLWGHEECEGCAEEGVGAPYERAHQGLYFPMGPRNVGGVCLI